MEFNNIDDILCPPYQQNRIKMVEKIREPYQRHTRNISTVSDISTQGSIEPLKRDENGEIRCVLLCDSETERKCVYESFDKSINDGESVVYDVQFLHHHWEQPHTECTGFPDCRSCLRGPSERITFNHMNSDSGLTTINTIPNNTAHTGDGFFRFSIDIEDEDTKSKKKTVFRVMLLSKDKQNLLKIISFDFLFVCMRVNDIHGNYDEGIWEFEFKRLERYSKKAVAPIVLLGYFRYMSQLGQLSPNYMDKTISVTLEESKKKIKKLGVKKRAIPRFVDFVGPVRPDVHQNDGPLFSRPSAHQSERTRPSTQLCKLFQEIERLYKHPGYVLQQCAINNNVTHFTKIIENPNCGLEDLTYSKHDASESNPIMIAAKLRHKDLVSSILRSNKFENSDEELLGQLIHSKNKSGDTLLHTVALQGPELEEQKLLILRKEIQLHVSSTKTPEVPQFSSMFPPGNGSGEQQEYEADMKHEKEQIKLQRCLRSQLKSSAEAAIILDQSRYLQGIPYTKTELKAERCKIWSKLFFASFLLFLLFQFIDSGSDIFIVVRYYFETKWYKGGANDAFIKSNNSDKCQLMGKNEEPNVQSTLNCDNAIERFSQGKNISIHCMVSKDVFPYEHRFAYTLFFLLVPWPFFIYEFFTSNQLNQFVNKGKEIVNEMASLNKCSDTWSFIKCYLKAIGYFILFTSCLIFWPIAVLFIKYHSDGKYYLAKGGERAAREKKHEASEVLWSIARVMEVSLESSFQPTIQLYIIFPTLYHQFQSKQYSLTLLQFCTDHTGMLSIKPDQTISIVTSILSLAWCFTSYHATLKRGALDKDLASLFYRSVLFLSFLFQVLGRLFIFVLFAYSFGPGKYYPMLVFFAIHIIMMTILHYIFSDAKLYWQKGGFMNFSFFHYMLGNGLANIYIHNWIRMDPLLIKDRKPLQHVATLVRQGCFDLVLVVENVVLLWIALHSEINELKDNRLAFSSVLLGFTLIGLILKWVYYRYLHMWAWLIMDYTTSEENGHWKCKLTSDMFLCGERKNRNLTLFCIPNFVMKCLTCLFGSKEYPDDGSGESSNSSCCKKCTYISSVFLVPLALVLGVLAVMLLLALIILFLPVFLVLILPCILVVKCRELGKKSGTVRKITEDEVSDEAEAHQPLSSSKDEMELLATNNKNNGNVIKTQPEPKIPSLAEEV